MKKWQRMNDRKVTIVSAWRRLGMYRTPVVRIRAMAAILWGLAWI